MTHEQLMNSMSADELRYWRADSELTPWGDERAELYAAMITQAVEAPYCKSTPKLGRYLLRWDADPDKERRDEEVKRGIMAAAYARKAARKQQEIDGEQHI